MSRLQGVFAALKSANQKALISFITAGDPQLDVTVAALHGLVAGGVNVLELGVPFSDPEAEGPSIQASSERALAQGITLKQCISMVGEFRQQDTYTPIVLMGYLNSVYKMGFATFAEGASSAGVDAVILVNLPPEELPDLQQSLRDNDIDLILLVAPTTTPERQALICSKAMGFVYYVSLKGTTGASHLDPQAVDAKVIGLKTLTDLPVVVGFGVKDGDTAKAVTNTADGVVVGSALVNTMAALAADPTKIPAALEQQVLAIRQKLDA